MEYKLLHLARAHAFFLLNPDVQSPLIDSQLMSVAALSQLDEETCRRIHQAVFPDSNSDGIRQIFGELSSFFMNASNELAAYMQEIQRRTNHAIQLGIYQPDTPEQLEAKQVESRDVCPTNHYFSGYLLLCKNGIDCGLLSISEALLAIDEITCCEINAGSSQVLAMIASDRPADETRFKTYLRHANFVAISLDIYNELDKLWTQVRNSKDMK